MAVGAVPEHVFEGVGGGVDVMRSTRGGCVIVGLVVPCGCGGLRMLMTWVAVSCDSPWGWSIIVLGCGVFIRAAAGAGAGQRYCWRHGWERGSEDMFAWARMWSVRGFWP